MSVGESYVPHTVQSGMHQARNFVPKFLAGQTKVVRLNFAEMWQKIGEICPKILAW